MPNNALGSPDPAANSLGTNGMIAEEVFPADFRWVRRGVQNVTHALAVLGIPAEKLGAIEIVLAEALNNIVEHAYFEGKTGDITVSVRRRSTSLMFEIRDRGRPMPNGRAPFGHYPMIDGHDDQVIPEGGYGWLLIRELVRDLIYDRRDGENILVFRMSSSSSRETTIKTA